MAQGVQCFTHHITRKYRIAKHIVCKIGRELIKKMTRFLKVSKLLELEWKTRWREGPISVESTDVGSAVKTLENEDEALRPPR